jgi:hypothetical protein
LHALVWAERKAVPNVSVGVPRVLQPLLEIRTVIRLPLPTLLVNAREQGETEQFTLPFPLSWFMLTVAWAMGMTEIRKRSSEIKIRIGPIFFKLSLSYEA